MNLNQNEIPFPFNNRVSAKESSSEEKEIQARSSSFHEKSKPKEESGLYPLLLMLTAMDLI